MEDNTHRELGKTREISRAIRRIISVAEGRDRDEVQSMLTDELRSRGIEPSSEQMDVYLAAIAKGIMAQNTGRPAAKVATRRGRRWARIVGTARFVRNARMARNILPQYSPGRRIRFFESDRTQSPMEVVLDTSARDWLASRKLKLPRRMDPSSRIDVWLDSMVYPDGRTAIRVHLKDRLIGHLRPEDGNVFLPVVEASHADKHLVMASGYIGHNDNGLHFYIYQPLTGFN